VREWVEWAVVLGTATGVPERVARPNRKVRTLKNLLRRSPRGRRVVLLATALGAVLAIPAAAATGVFTDAGSDLQAESWADIETYGVDADTNRLDLSVGGPDLVDRHDDQDHSLIFRLDTDGDNDTDFSVVADGGTLAGVYAGENRYTKRLCSVKAKMSSKGAHVVAATRCVGNPASVHVAAVLMSGRDTCGYGICYETSIDFAPDGQSNSSRDADRFSPAVTVTAVPAPVWAFKSTGRVGGVARLRVATEVGAEYSRFLITVTGKNGTVATIKAPVLERGPVQFVAWRVPKTVKPGTLRFSVQGIGTTKSAKVYAPLVLSKPV
jgi:hypothetical protein